MPGDNQAGERENHADASTLGIMAGIVAGFAEDFRRTNAVNRRYAMLGTARSLLPGWRVAECMRVPAGRLVSVIHHQEYDAASFAGLHCCANVHVCPCCGSKIAGRRAEEIAAGYTRWTEEGGGILMATYTLRHDQADGLADVAGALNESYRQMRQARAWRDLAGSCGLIGSITAREYTHGVRGWHPHLHALLFVRGGLKRRELADLQRGMRAQWSHALERLGRDASWEHGVVLALSQTDAIAEYMAKAGKQWTIADELARSNLKRGRRGNQNVPQLLWAAGGGDSEAAGLFVEYAQHTYRRNALVWTPGLRRRLGVAQELSDEELAEQLAADGRLMVVLTRGQWLVVLGHDARAELLMSAAAGDVEQVVQFLDSLGIGLEAWQLDPERAQRVDELARLGLTRNYARW